MSEGTVAILSPAFQSRGLINLPGQEWGIMIGCESAAV
jgi:hypothetical protein